MLKADLVRIQFNQVLNGKETLWRAFAGRADDGLLLKGRLRADGYQFDEVVLVHETLVDADNEMSEGLKFNEYDSCNVKG
jgi:hypothetical protein